jgi:hypothetical protein
VSCLGCPPRWVALPGVSVRTPAHPSARARECLRPRPRGAALTSRS